MLEFSAHVCLAVAIASLAVIILVLRDTRGRINLRVLLVLVAFAALGFWAVNTMMKFPWGEMWQK